MRIIQKTLDLRHLKIYWNQKAGKCPITALPIGSLERKGKNNHTFDEGGGYFAYYKDFKGVMGDGESEAEAISDVKEAFKFCIQTDLKEGVVIPEPQGEEKLVRVNVSLPKSLLDAIDRVSSNRSAFLTKAANMALNT